MLSATRKLLEMDESLTLVEIENRAGVALNRLRYVIDSKILPGNRDRATVWQARRGVARKFTKFEAFGIVVTVLLLDHGVKRNVVMQVMDLLCDYTKPKTRDLRYMPLYSAFLDKTVTALQIGDGVNMRLCANQPDVGGLPANAWLQVVTRARIEQFAPLVVMEINLTRLREIWN